jgi:hypothetical protein
MPRKPKITAEERREAFKHESFPESATKLTDVQVWQRRLEQEAVERAQKRAKRKPTGGQRNGIKTIPLMKKICARIGDGESLSKICEDADMPSRHTVWEWIREDEAYKALYNAALADRGEVLADGIIELSDEARLAPPELTNAYRLAVDSRKWAAARLLPRKYGDRVTLSGDSENPVQVQHVEASEGLLAKLRGTK